MSSATLIFPHQLFQQHPALQKDSPVYLVEEWLFFSQYNFHQQKILLHRTSMKAYASFLQSKNFKVNYVDAQTPESDVRVLIAGLAKQGVQAIHVADVVDDWLNKRLVESCAKNKVQKILYATPNFLNQMNDVKDFFDKKKTYFQTDFYVAQRKQRNILLEKDGKPTGGKWTFDADNRERFPKNQKPPTIAWPKENEFVREAKIYVQKHFAKNYGSIDGLLHASGTNYPTTFAEAENWLTDFLKNRFAQFGVYEDALVAKEYFLHHSVLTPMLNIGLLQPQQIIDKAIDHAAKHSIPLNSLEGFIRQIVGWREFIRIVYEREGKLQRTKNYWGFTRKIPKQFWTGETGIEPIDCAIKKVLQTGYNHHIERLMLLGNFMLLCEFDPNEVHRWFMEMYVDAYDWVMVPNVYGMTQFADGGLMTTKPYISGSNYVLKMGDFAKGEWTTIWDGLFWHFMHLHRTFFLQNPRLGMLVSMFDKMPEDKRKNHLQVAENFLRKLDADLKN
jgi:deoxyribodipyrimidine photolyase-related protein